MAIARFAKDLSLSKTSIASSHLPFRKKNRLIRGDIKSWYNWTICRTTEDSFADTAVRWKPPGDEQGVLVRQWSYVGHIKVRQSMETPLRESYSHKFGGPPFASLERSTATADPVPEQVLRSRIAFFLFNHQIIFSTKKNRRCIIALSGSFFKTCRRGIYSCGGYRRRWSLRMLNCETLTDVCIWQIYSGASGRANWPQTSDLQTIRTYAVFSFPSYFYIIQSHYTNANVLRRIHKGELSEMAAGTMHPALCINRRNWFCFYLVHLIFQGKPKFIRIDHMIYSSCTRSWKQGLINSTVVLLGGSAHCRIPYSVCVNYLRFQLPFVEIYCRLSLLFRKFRADTLSVRAGVCHITSCDGARCCSVKLHKMYLLSVRNPYSIQFRPPQCLNSNYVNADDAR